MKNKETYKGYQIIIKKQKPNVKIPITDEDFEKHFNKNDPNETHGTHWYEILDKKGNRLIMDDKDMWDYDACLENATQDIDATLE